MNGIIRDSGLVIGGAYLVLITAVFIGAVIGDRFGKDYDRRNRDDDERTAP